MAKWSNDLVMDAALGYVGLCDRIFVCSDQPADFTGAGTTLMLATGTVTVASFGTADGTSGRKLTVAQQASIPVANSGSATHVALGKITTDELTYVTTCTGQQLTAGNTVTVPAWIIQVDDPT